MHITLPGDLFELQTDNNNHFLRLYSYPAEDRTHDLQHSSENASKNPPSWLSVKKIIKGKETMKILTNR